MIEVNYISMLQSLSAISFLHSCVSIVIALIVVSCECNVSWDFIWSALREEYLYNRCAEKQLLYTVWSGQTVFY